jgi:hypothetical protein
VLGVAEGPEVPGFAEYEVEAVELDVAGELVSDHDDRVCDLGFGVQVQGACGVVLHQKGGSDLGDDVNDPVRRQRPAMQDGGEVGSLDQPHVDVELSVDLPEVMDRDHVRFVQTGGEGCQVPEPGHGV